MNFDEVSPENVYATLQNCQARSSKERIEDRPNVVFFSQSLKISGADFTFDSLPFAIAERLLASHLLAVEANLSRRQSAAVICGKERSVNIKKTVGTLAISAAAAALCAGCISSKREITTQPPVVQVPAPAVVVQQPPPPASTSKSTTTTWGNGAIVQKQTTTSGADGDEKRTTTTWNNGGTPETTTTTTTSNQ